MGMLPICCLLNLLSAIFCFRSDGCFPGRLRHFVANASHFTSYLQQFGANTLVLPLWCLAILPHWFHTSLTLLGHRSPQHQAAAAGSDISTGYRYFRRGNISCLLRFAGLIWDCTLVILSDPIQHMYRFLPNQCFWGCVKAVNIKQFWLPSNTMKRH